MTHASVIKKMIHFLYVSHKHIVLDTNITLLNKYGDMQGVCVSL